MYKTQHEVEEVILSYYNIIFNWPLRKKKNFL